MTAVRAALAAVLLASAAAAQPAGAPGVALDQRALLNPLSEISVDSLEAFRERPLFVPSRRPPPPPPVYEPEPEPEPVVLDEPEPEPVEEIAPPDVILSGILEVDAVPVAVLRDLAEDLTLSVRVGDPVAEWTVAAIGEGSVTLELEGEEHEIRIFEPGGGDDGFYAPTPQRIQPGRLPDIANRQGIDGAGMPGQPAGEPTTFDESDFGIVDAADPDSWETDDGSMDDEMYDESTMDEGYTDEELMGFEDEVPFDAAVDEGDDVLDAGTDDQF